MDHYKNILIPIITKHLPHSAMYLFGSRAQNMERSGSDVDIVLDNKAPIAWTEMIKIKDDIEESCIPVFVDVLDMHTLAPDFVDHIKKEWIVWKNYR